MLFYKQLLDIAYFSRPIFSIVLFHHKWQGKWTYDLKNTLWDRKIKWGPLTSSRFSGTVVPYLIPSSLRENLVLVSNIIWIFLCCQRELTPKFFFHFSEKHNELKISQLYPKLDIDWKFIFWGKRSYISLTLSSNKYEMHEVSPGKMKS